MNISAMERFITSVLYFNFYMPGKSLEYIEASKHGKTLDMLPTLKKNLNPVCVKSLYEINNSEKT